MTKFKSFKFELNIIDLFIIIYYVYQICNIEFLNNNITRNNDFILLSTILLFYIIAKTFFKNLFLSQKPLTYLVILINVLCLIPIIIGILEYFEIIQRFDHQFRMSGGFVNPNVFANFIIPFFPFLISLVLFAKELNKILIIFSVFTLILLCIVLFFINSRTAWIAGLISFAYILINYPIFKIFIKRKLNTIVKKISILSILFILTFFLIYFFYNYKINSSNGRLFVWKITINTIKEKPILGSGYNTFIKTYNTHEIDYFKKYPNDIKNGLLASNITFAFNEYLQITLELGIAGLVIFLLLIFFVLTKKTYINFRYNYLVFGMRAGIIAILICGLFSYPFRVANSLLWFYFSLAFISSVIRPFNIKPNKYFTILITTSIFLASTFFLIIQGSTFQKTCEWKKAYSLTEEKKYEDALNIYKEIEPDMKYNFYFLFNYGTFLYTIGFYDKSIEFLELAKKYQVNYELYLNLANCYKSLYKYDEAEDSYINALNLIPFKFTPRYELFKLYIQTKEPEKASKIASIINSLPIKVYSQQVGQIKKEAIEYLRLSNKKKN